MMNNLQIVNVAVQRFANVATDSIEGFKESKYKHSLINLLRASLGRLS